MRSTFERWFGEWDTAKAGALAPGADCRRARRGDAAPPRSRRAAAGARRPESDAAAAARRGDDGGAAGDGAGQAEAGRARCWCSARPRASCIRRFRWPAARSRSWARRPARGRRPSPTIPPTSTSRTSSSTTRSSSPARPARSSTIANDAAATAARRKALLDFVRGGKGLAGIHAATDSYHQNAPAATPPAAGGGCGARARVRRAQVGAGRGGFGRPRRHGAARGIVHRAGGQEQRSAAEPGRVRRRSLTSGTASSIRPTPGRVEPGGLRPALRRRDPATAPAGGRVDLRAAASGLHRLLEPAGGHAARPGQPGRHLAGVQQDDWRVLQVALEQPAGDHLQDRRAEPSAERAVQEAQRTARRSTTRPTPWAATPTRARTCAC